MLMRKIVLLFASVIMFACSPKKTDNVLLLSDDMIETVNFEDAVCDIQIFRVKSSAPMKGIEQFFEAGDYILALSTDHGTVYWIKGDTVVSVLERKGRGPGEYPYINDFVYNPIDSILYLSDINGTVLKYQGINHTYLGKIEGVPSVSDLFLSNGDTVITAYSETDENNILHFGLVLEKISTAQILEEILPMDYNSQYWSAAADFYKVGDSIWFTVPGNRMSLNLFYKGTVYPQFCFEFDKKWQIPEEVIPKDLKPATPDDMSSLEKYMTYNEFIMSSDFCSKATATIYDNGRYLFWNYVKANAAILNIVQKQDVKRYTLKLEGFQNSIQPDLKFKDYYATTFNCPYGYEVQEDDDFTKSPIAQKIKHEMDLSDGDPVIMLYHIK